MTMRKILGWIKKRVDKAYYSSYTREDEGALIRTAFPGIAKVGEYQRVQEYATTSGPHELDQLTGMIMSFYWGEVERLTSQGEFGKVERYQGLVDFCQALRDFSSELYILNNHK